MLPLVPLTKEISLMILKRAWVMRLLAATMLLLPSVTAKAVITSTKDSSLFTFKYEMDVSPDVDNQGGAAGGDWTMPAGSVSGGIFTLTTTAPINAEIVNSDTGGGLSFATGYTIEMRAKVDTTFNRTATMIGGAGPLGSNRGWLSIGQSQLRWMDTGSDTSGTQLDTSVNSDGFHIFRLAQEPNTNLYSVWRDGVLISNSLVSTNTGGSIVKASFGDLGATWGGTLEVDYYRFDTSGAYAPMPEPSALILVVCAGSALALRRMCRARKI